MKAFSLHISDAEKISIFLNWSGLADFKYVRSALILNDQIKDDYSQLEIRSFVSRNFYGIDANS